MNFKGDDNPLWRQVRNLGREEGQALVEYGLILMFVSIVALSLSPIGPWVAARFGDLSAAL